MSQQIKWEVIGDQIKITSPFNQDFVFRAKRMRGQWKDGTWWFDDSIAEYVRELMIEVFGTSGEASYNNVTLVVTGFSNSESSGTVSLFGRTIAKAFGRDSGAKLGDDIYLVAGDIDSGGSVRNWRTIVRNATFEIHNFPEPSLYLPEVQQAIADGWCRVKIPTKKRSRHDIETEIAQLQTRILELINELGYDS